MKRTIKKTKDSRRSLRHLRVRAVVKGTAECPRLSVFRGLRKMVAQLIDDTTSKTLVYVESTGLTAKPKAKEGAKVALAFAVGEKLAAAAKAKKITKIVFDRGGYRYHGRVQAVAEGARAGGLEF